MKISNEYSEVVIHRTTYNTMTKRKRSKGQTMICKSLHRKPTKEQNKPHKIVRVNTEFLTKFDVYRQLHQ